MWKQRLRIAPTRLTRRTRWWVEQPFDLKPKCLIGDTAYGTAELPGWMVDEKAIEPHVPVWEKSERNDGTFSRSDFE